MVWFGEHILVAFLYNKIVQGNRMTFGVKDIFAVLLLLLLLLSPLLLLLLLLFLDWH